VGLIVKLALIVCLGVNGQWHEGKATHYASGLMEKVSARRGLPVVACMIAHPQIPIGSWLLVSGVRTGVLLSCRVTDMSRPQDRQRHMRTGLIELDYESAKAVCGVWFASRSRECPVAVGR
jgi:hypothetical protein